MSFIIDLVIIAAAAAAIYLGTARGFIKSVTHLLSLILAVAAVFFFTAPASEWINEKLVGSRISAITEDSLNGIVDAGVERLKLDKVFNDRPDALISVTERFSVDIEELSSYYTDFLGNLVESVAIEELADKLAAPTSSALSTVLAAIAVFVVALLAMKLISAILELIFRLPVLKRLNRFLGFLFGVCSAAVVALVIANLSAGLILALEPLNGDLFNSAVIDSSVILRFLYSNSLLMLG